MAPSERNPLCVFLRRAVLGGGLGTLGCRWAEARGMSANPAEGGADQHWVEPLAVQFCVRLDLAFRRLSRWKF